jgi:hypothetical protein
MSVRLTIEERESLCAEMSHPGATYNPWMERTWCACGGATYDGDQSSHVACCGGPLDRHKPSIPPDIQRGDDRG